jgi:hypothetical protein
MGIGKNILNNIFKKSAELNEEEKKEFDISLEKSAKVLEKDIQQVIEYREKAAKEAIKDGLIFKI